MTHGRRRRGHRMRRAALAPSASTLALVLLAGLEGPAVARGAGRARQILAIPPFGAALPALGGAQVLWPPAAERCLAAATIRTHGRRRRGHRMRRAALAPSASTLALVLLA